MPRLSMRNVEKDGETGDGKHRGESDREMGRLEQPVFWFGDHIDQVS